jgi:hypothetical protein
MKNILYLLGLFLAILAGCSTTEDEEISPNPKEIIDLSMRSDNKNSSLGGFMYIDKDNYFTTSDEDTYIVPVGIVRGLRNVSIIPKAGWSKKATVITGSGYVVCHENQFYRLFVQDCSMDAFNGIASANIQYQKPFMGQGSDINLQTNSVIFTPSLAQSIDVSLDHSEIEPFDIGILAADVGWCSAYLKPVLDNDTLSMHLIVSVKSYSDVKKVNNKNRETTIAISSITKFTNRVIVIQEGVEPYIKISGNGISSPIYYQAKKASYSILIKTNVPFDSWDVMSDQEWNKEWFHVAKSSNSNNLNDTTIDINIEENSSGRERKGKIILYSSEYEIDDTIDIIQINELERSEKVNSF